jgi:hypothetical protein
VTIAITLPCCGATQEVPDDYRGKRVKGKCPKCFKEFHVVVPTSGGGVLSERIQAPPADPQEKITRKTRANDVEAIQATSAKQLNVARDFRGKSLSKSRLLANALITFGVICMFVCCANFVYLFATCGAPDPGTVEVEIANLPVGTNFASVASEANGNLQSMKWYIGSNGLYASRTYSAASDMSYRNPKDPNEPWNKMVVWTDGARYGIVTRNQKGEWHVTWFGPEILQGRKAKFDLSKGVKLPLTPEKVKELGLDAVKMPQLADPRR